jgi:hypothetical protein
MSITEQDVSVLYHASPIQGLTQLLPRVGTHGHAWVYATPDMVIASLFLGRLGGDLTCQVGTVGGHPYVRERFRGAFDLRYDIGGASLYRLSAEGFTSGKTSWKQDWVCEHPIFPLQEITIDDVRSHLLGFVDEGRLALHRCDDTDASAEADADLSPVFVQLYARGGDKVLAHVTCYYPHLVDQLLAGQKR